MTTAEKVLKYLESIEFLLNELVKNSTPYKVEKGNNKGEDNDLTPRVAPIGFQKPETMEDLINRLVNARLTALNPEKVEYDDDDDEAWLDDDDDSDHDSYDYERSPEPDYASEKQPQTQKVESESAREKSAQSAVSQPSESAPASVEKSPESD